MLPTSSVPTRMLQPQVSTIARRVSCVSSHSGPVAGAFCALLATGSSMWGCDRKAVRRSSLTVPTIKHTRGISAKVAPFWQDQHTHDYVLLWPRNFGEVPAAINALKECRTVVINLDNMQCTEEQQRSIDFVAGGCHALGGQQGMLAEGVFIFTPPGVQVHTSSDKRDALISLARTDLLESGAGHRGESF